MQFPTFERFMELVRNARKAIEEHPKTKKPGQIWGISGLDFRFIIVKVLDGNLRVVPVRQALIPASSTEFIVPEKTVFNAKSVLNPFLICNILTEYFDLYFGEFLIPLDTKGFPVNGELDYGDIPAADPVILGEWDRIKSITYRLSEEVLEKIDDGKISY